MRNFGRYRGAADSTQTSHYRSRITLTRHTVLVQFNLVKSGSLAALAPGPTSRLRTIHELSSAEGSVNRNAAPRGWFGSAHSLPPCAWMMERQIDSPMPVPLNLVV